MAENEVKIKVTTETDTVELEQLDTLVDDIQEKADITVSIDADDSSINEADDTAQQLSDDLDGIDGKIVSPEVDSSGLEDLKNDAEETSSAMDNVATAAVGIGTAAGVEQMVSTADRINTSWNRLELTFANTGVSMDTLKGKSNELSNSTGRAGGVIRDYFNQMGIAGVRNTDLLASSFEALSGRSYQTGNSIESMESKMQRMVLSGSASNIALRSLGLNAESLAASMGVSADEVSKAFEALTPEERLQAITKAMGDGAAANEMYKNSYEGLKAQADAAMAGLMGAVGQAILPVLVPALQAATNAIKFLTDGFKALPGPVQGIIGGMAGFAAIALTVVGVLGTVGQVVKMVQGGLQALNLITKLSEMATKAFAVAEWLLNAAMAANPIVLVVLALVALAAALVWAYYNVDWFRAMVDNAWASLVQFGQYIYGVVAGAIQWLGSLFNQFTSQIGLNTNDWIQAILGFILFIPQLPLQLAVALANAIAKTLGFGNNFVQTITNSAVRSVTNFMQWISSLPGRLQAELNRMLSAVGEWAATLPQKFWDAGVNAVKNFLNALGIHSPGYMYWNLYGELGRLEDLPEDMEGNITGNISRLGSKMSSAFNPNLETGNIRFSEGTGVPSQTLIFNFNDTVVDNEERMQRIAEYIAKSINWDNTTAGRTV